MELLIIIGIVIGFRLINIIIGYNEFIICADIIYILGIGVLFVKLYHQYGYIDSLYSVIGWIVYLFLGFVYMAFRWSIHVSALVVEYNHNTDKCDRADINVQYQTHIENTDYRNNVYKILYWNVMWPSSIITEILGVGMYVCKGIVSIVCGRLLDRISRRCNLRLPS